MEDNHKRQSATTKKEMIIRKITPTHINRNLVYKGVKPPLAAEVIGSYVRRWRTGVKGR